MHLVQIIGSSPYGAEDVIVNVTPKLNVKSEHGVAQILHGQSSNLMGLGGVHRILPGANVERFVAALNAETETDRSERNLGAHCDNIRFSVVDYGTFTSLADFFAETGLDPSEYTAETPDIMSQGDDTPLIQKLDQLVDRRQKLLKKLRDEIHEEEERRRKQDFEFQLGAKELEKLRKELETMQKRIAELSFGRRE